MSQGGTPLAVAARYRHPTGGVRGRLMGALVGCSHWTAWRRWLMARVPMPALASDVADVVYMTWWVEVGLLPAPPSGFRYWASEGRTPFTILTYRHGSFGPALLGRLRRLLPSPLQSNWRWYLQREGDPAEAMPVVLFARNVMDSLPHVAGARLLSDAMQPHLAAAFMHRREEGHFLTCIDPGDGSAPILRASLRDADSALNDAAWWLGAFGSREQAWAFLACQDEALAVAPDGRLALTRIDLPVDLTQVQALFAERGGIDCPLLDEMGGDVNRAFCFLLPRVPFRVVSECLL